MINLSQFSYSQLRDTYAQRTQQVVAWVGSGLSTSAGFPSWEQLRSLLHRTGVSKSTSLPPFEGTELAQALARIEAISDNWVAFGKLRDTIGGTTFTAVIRESLKSKSDTKCPEVYHGLWKLRLGGILSLNL